MATCTNCRRVVDETVDGSVEGTVLVRLCDDCETELVDGSTYKKLKFEA